MTDYFYHQSAELLYCIFKFLCRDKDCYYNQATLLFEFNNAILTFCDRISIYCKPDCQDLPEISLAEFTVFVLALHTGFFLDRRLKKTFFNYRLHYLCLTCNSVVPNIFFVIWFWIRLAVLTCWIILHI